MDFELDEEQAAIAELAGTILADLCTAEALRTHEQSGAAVHAAAWEALAKADLVGVALPEAAGGGGYGILAAFLIAEQVGRWVAPVPYAAVMAASLALDADRLGALGRVADGSLLVVPAVGDGEVDAADGGSGRGLTGEVRSVPWAAQADQLLVPSADSLYLVDPADRGVRFVEEDAMWGLPQATVELTAAAGVPVGGADAVADLARYAVALQCATVAGVCEGALRVTAAHVSEREQFGTKIGTFQAVAQRIADAYIDTQGARLTALQAAWRLSAGVPADDELHIAKFWAADAGHRVGHAAQHLHGGVGMDTDYAVHRYFRWAKVLELQLGSATDHLRRLGARIAAEPV